MTVTTKKPAKQSDKFDKASAIEKQIAALNNDLAAVYQEIANDSCPYKPGQTIVTAKGLGQQGLAIQAIIAPKFPRPGNTWALDTFAVSKSGEVTRRAVLVEEDWQWGGIVEVK